jgi:hypothetical protein
MKRRLKSIAAVFFIVCMMPSHAQNPIVQTRFTPDPAPMVYNDTVRISYDYQLNNLYIIS